MNFLNTWQELEEIYKADYASTGKEEVKSSDAGLSSGLLYHFYEDLSDLLNSLNTGIIYSTKNDKKENKAQFDFSLEDGDGKAYVCMTNSEAGKRYMVKSYRRPFGLSFDAKELETACVAKGAFIRGYSAFGTKADYTMVKGKPSLLAQTAERGTNPFVIYAVGELLDGTYFVSGGQGMNKLWASQLFYDEQLYNELRDWFMKNLETGEEYQRRMFYHFREGRVHSNPNKPKLTDANGKPIEADLNLNKDYVARKDFNKTGDDSYNSSMCFDFTGVYASKFREVLGYGPINVVDDSGTVLLKLTAVNPNAKGGYRGPFLFGKNVDTGELSDTTSNFRARPNSTTRAGEDEKIKSTQQHLIAGKELFQKLCQVYNEYEYRIYLPTSGDFRFAPEQIQTLVLPETFEIKASKESINLSKLRDVLDIGTPADISPESLEAMGIISKAAKRAPFTPRCLDLVRTLIKLLTSTYSKVGVELIPNSSIDSQATFTSYLGTGEVDNQIHRNQKGKLVAGDKVRKVIQSWPDLKTAHIVPGQNGEQTVVATIDIPTVGPAEARLGSEIILVAEDENRKKYVLFVYKSKSTTFMELPGGGFMTKPTSDLDFDDLIYDKLNFKCNVKQSDIHSLADTGSSLVLYEPGVAKDKDVQWDWSYYRLYTAKYTHLLTAEHLATLGYSYDNGEEALRRANELGIPVNGYRAHMRWVPVEGIELNRAITDRYSNIIPLIKSTAATC
jgi:hypothetical protein